MSARRFVIVTVAAVGATFFTGWLFGAGGWQRAVAAAAVAVVGVSALLAERRAYEAGRR